MRTQQLLEMLRTWPEFETVPLDWLEQYPPDTPIMDALRNAPGKALRYHCRGRG